jgi:hypothetical protein
MLSIKHKKHFSIQLVLLIIIFSIFGLFSIGQTSVQAKINSKQVDIELLGIKQGSFIHSPLAENEMFVFGMEVMIPEGFEQPNIQTKDSRNGYNPYIAAYPEDNYVSGQGWPSNSEVTLTIGANQWTSQTNEGSIASFVLSPFELQAGQTLQMTDGIYTRTHIVKDMAINEIDEVTDSISGTADPNSNFRIDASNGVNYEWIDITVDPSGHWKANFSIDIAEGSQGYTYQIDGEGNRTITLWFIPDPTIIVYPRQDTVGGSKWAKEAEITLTIGGSQWISQSNFNGSVEINVSPFGLKAGQAVEMTDGTLTRTYTIENLTITGIDEAADIVYGHADPNSDVTVMANSVNNNQYDQITVTADGSGHWQTDFSATVDIDRDAFTTAYQRDSEGNMTIIHWHFFSSYLPILIQ